MSPCATPVSWLALERLHLGELSDPERARVREHLAGCAGCRAALEQLERDDARALPKLPSRRPLPYARIAVVASSLALAASLVLVLGRTPQEGVGVKGADIAFTLVPDDDGTSPTGPIDEAGGAYRDGQRFKALVTCPPGMQIDFDVAVFERGEVFFPLPATATAFTCGNAVPLPGAFRVTGNERLTVCLVFWPDGPLDREAVRRAAPRPPENAHCKVLEPIPPPVP